MIKYIGIIFDVKDSKHSINRNELQKHINKVLTEINEKYQDKLVLNFSITLGDEFQGLVKDTSVLFEIIHKIKNDLDEVNLRCGIGIGSLVTDIIQSSSSLGTDGPVWWNARKAIEELKNFHEHGTKKNCNIKIKGFKNINLENLINQVLVFTYYHEEKFTIKQREIVKDLITLYGINTDFKQIDFANITRRNVKSVGKIINTIKYYDYIEVFRYIEETIKGEMTVEI